MITNESSTSVLDYSEAFIRIQHLHRDLQKQVLAKDYVQARELARAMAIEAMHIGIWCRQFIDTTERETP
jgi:hypothetical protein